MRLPRGKKRIRIKERDQTGRRNARSQAIAKHPANLEEGLAISCTVCDCSLIGQWCCYCRCEQGCSGIFTSSWGPQRPTAKFWVVANMTTSNRQLRILLSLFHFKIKKLVWWRSHTTIKPWVCLYPPRFLSLWQQEELVFLTRDTVKKEGVLFSSYDKDPHKISQPSITSKRGIYISKCLKWLNSLYQ